MCLTTVFLQRTWGSPATPGGQRCVRWNYADCPSELVFPWRDYYEVIDFLPGFWAEINLPSPNNQLDLRQMSSRAKFLCPGDGHKNPDNFPQMLLVAQQQLLCGCFPQFLCGSKGRRRVSYTGILERKTIYVSLPKQVLTLSLRCHLRLLTASACCPRLYLLGSDDGAGRGTK